MKTIVQYRLLLLFVLIVTQFSNNLFAQNPAEIKLIKKTVIGGEGGWDYLTVDSENRRLYVSHSSQVEVLNVDTHEKIGVIPNTQGVHGICIVQKTGRGLTTNGRSNSATVFDLNTLDKIAEIPTGANPDAVLYDKFSDRIFVFNHSGHSATAIDLKAAKNLGTIELGGDGVEAGVSDGKGTIFVNLEDASQIVSFDPKSLNLKDRWSVSPGEEPTGLAYDPETKRLFSVCHNGLMMVLDSENGKVIAQLPIGRGVDGAVFDPVSKCVISSNGEGSLTVVKENSANDFEVIQTVTTEVGARTITYDPKTQHVFVSTAQYGPAPEATADNPRPRRSVVPDTFMVLEYGRK